MTAKKITEDFKEAFLDMLGQLPNITAVCRLMGITTSTVHRERHKDAAFDLGIKAAVEEGYDVLEEEARRRAAEGVLEPVYYKGEVVGEIRKYSDQLLTFLLRGYRPKRFNPGAKLSCGDGQKVTMTFNIKEEGE